MDTLILPTRPLGATGLRVTPITLASFSMASSHGCVLKPEDVERAFHEHGLNTFFVSWMMPALVQGVRRLVRGGHRDRIVLISGVGLPFAGSVRRAWEKNARALGVEMIDAWLFGWVKSRWWLRDRIWEEMQRIKAAGKTRAIGFSSHDRPLAARLARERKADVLMVRYSAAHRGAEAQVFDTLGAERPGILAYTATRWGMLLDPLPKRGFPRAMAAPECYRFVLGNPAVDAVLCGALSYDQIRQDVEGVLAGPLDPARLEEVRRFGDAVHAAARGSRRWAFRERRIPPPAGA